MTAIPEYTRMMMKPAIAGGLSNRILKVREYLWNRVWVSPDFSRIEGSSKEKNQLA